jgi:DNA-binding NtrC family response regulator
MFRRGELIKNDVFALGSGGLLQHNGAEGTGARYANRQTPTASDGIGDAPAIESILLDAIEGGMGLEDVERRVYATALAKTKGNVSGAARLLKISRAQLDYRINKGSFDRNLPGRVT